MDINYYEELLNEFLQKWTIDEIKNMTLKEYVGVGNKDTFCQWVETKTRILGSIKGLSSIKFGIYERKQPKKKPKNFENDAQYSWIRGYGSDRKIAFEKIKKDILNIIRLSEVGNFEQIDKVRLPDLFKWKIAFLFSNKRLIPIYKRDILFKIGNHFGLQTSQGTKISDIQNVMMLNKPECQDVYQFMRFLLSNFGDSFEKKEIFGRTPKKIQLRKPATERSIKPQIRKITSSFVVEQKHNKIQNALRTLLIKQYGKKNVIMEENYVDLKLIQPNYISFYEVKSSSYAVDCIKEALGQILLYSSNDTDKRQKKHFVVGQYPASDNEMKYIDFLKRNFKLEFDYLNVEIK